MEEIYIEDTVKSVNKTAVGICIGFTVGFLCGAAIMAVIDHYDNKKNKQKKLRRDSDENYIYSE